MCTSDPIDILNDLPFRMSSGSSQAPPKSNILNDSPFRMSSRNSQMPPKSNTLNDLPFTVFGLVNPVT